MLLAIRDETAAGQSLYEVALEVRGDLRSYKIHLGVGNIVMKLSIILSKVFLLAEDRKITDPAIVREIRID